METATGTAYDRIGRGYRELRKPDPRIRRALEGALGDSRTVVNVGAGAGSYEPRGCDVLAVEPSAVMIAQRETKGRVVQARAEALPLRDRSFDAGMGVLTLHHWEDPERGLSELRRVVRDRLVFLTWVPDAPRFWLDAYFPQILEIDRRIFPSTDRVLELFGAGAEASVVPIPEDCTDGFLGAYWKRPHAYLDPRVRSAISTFTKLEDPRPGLARLDEDLRSGAWEERFGRGLPEGELDLGYRLVVVSLRSGIESAEPEGA